MNQVLSSPTGGGVKVWLKESSLPVQRLLIPTGHCLKDSCVKVETLSSNCHLTPRGHHFSTTN